MTVDSLDSTDERPLICLLTPQGRGAIATVGVRGTGGLETVARCFFPHSDKTLSSYMPGSVVVGRFLSRAGAGEELVVGICSSNLVEINCHGGRASAAAVIETLSELGCRQVSSRDWIDQLEPDSARGAALVALADASTARAAGHLLDQAYGALSRELGQIERWHMSGQPDRAKQAAAALLRSADFGLHLTTPWRIALAGPPNSGKSSLMNAILGYQRSIVFNRPGTTRDVLTATTAIDGWPVELFDTAGLRTAFDPLESEGVARARRELASADLVLFVSDNTSAWEDTLYRSVFDAKRERVLVVHNKSDLAAAPRDGRPAGVEISALDGTGVETLCQAAMQALIPEVPSRGSAIPFTTDQVATLRRYS
jgi:tRNA modification GTPase